QGQEFASSSPFYFFADHQPELAALVDRGRREFLTQFPCLTLPETLAQVPAPHEFETFAKSRLDFSERTHHAAVYSLHCDLLKLRREDPVLRSSRPRGMDGAVLAPHAFVMRFFGDGGDDRLVIVNLDHDWRLDPAPEPLLAPPADCVWKLVWSSDDVKYGGCGTPPLEGEENWFLPGETAVVLKPHVLPKS